MTTALGRVVRLSTDMRGGGSIVEGDVIQTGSGRSYRVLESRLMTRGPHAGYRYRYTALVIDPASVELDDHVIEIRWHRR